MELTGKVHRFGDDVNTDEIIPARYLNTSDHLELAKHAMEDADPEFVNKMKAGDFIVAGKNFGCGSSREHAPIALKAAGVAEDRVELEICGDGRQAGGEQHLDMVLDPGRMFTEFPSKLGEGGGRVHQPAQDSHTPRISE